jgi:hypothetical protein
MYYAKDANEQLILDSEISVVVLGRGERFFLFRSGETTLEEAQTVARLNGYTYCGVIGVTDGEAKVVCESDAASLRTMLHAGLAFAGMIAESLKQNQLSADFCERLYALPDPRA